MRFPPWHRSEPRLRGSRGPENKVDRASHTIGTWDQASASALKPRGRPLRLRRSGLGPCFGVRADADATKLQELPAAQGIFRRKTKKPLDRLRFIGGFSGGQPRQPVGATRRWHSCRNLAPTRCRQLPDMLPNEGRHGILDSSLNRSRESRAHLVRAIQHLTDHHDDLNATKVAQFT